MEKNHTPKAENAVMKIKAYEGSKFWPLGKKEETISDEKAEIKGF